MKLLEFFLGLLFSTPLLAYISAHVCPAQSVVTIACTDECQIANKNALQQVASKMEIVLNLISLRNSQSANLFEKVDGYLVEGGPDINFSFYRHLVSDYSENEEYEAFVNPGMSEDKIISNLERDKFEYNLLKQYFSETKQESPTILGICRGMQMLTVASKIPLYVDITFQLGISPFSGTIENIAFTKELSLLRMIFPGKRQIKGYERHHQSLHHEYYIEHRKEFSNIKISADMHAGKLTEAIEFTDRPVLGVQFHPELSGNDVKTGVFSWFLSSACNSKQEKKTK